MFAHPCRLYLRRSNQLDSVYDRNENISERDQVIKMRLEVNVSAVIRANHRAHRRHHALCNGAQSYRNKYSNKILICARVA